VCYLLRRLRGPAGPAGGAPIGPERNSDESASSGTRGRGAGANTASCDAGADAPGGARPEAGPGAGLGWPGARSDPTATATATPTAGGATGVRPTAVHVAARGCAADTWGPGWPGNLESGPGRVAAGDAALSWPGQSGWQANPSRGSTRGGGYSRGAACTASAAPGAGA